MGWIFGFIDASSGHAHALAQFHGYVMFFLILIIIFVIWLLKMVLRFQVRERNLKVLPTLLTRYDYFLDGVETLSFEAFCVYGYLLSHLFYNTFYKKIGYQFIDIIYTLLLTFNITKGYYSYGLKKTMYPDQGRIVNIFPLLPSLISSSHEIKSLIFPGGLLKLFLSGRSMYVNSMVFALRHKLHDVPFIFPYERVEFWWHPPYRSVEQYLTLQLHTLAYVYKLKSLSYKNFIFTDFNKKILNKNKTDNAGVVFKLNEISTKTLFGYIPRNIGILYKKYSRYIAPYFSLIMFHGTEARMFLYLFFLNVKHRKTLEWVWTCVPAFILALILYPSLLLLYGFDRPHTTKPYFTFKAVGHQWYWSYEMSDWAYDTDNVHVDFESYMLHIDDLEYGALRLLEVDRRVIMPVGLCARLVVTSADVLHSWAVPALGVKIDAVPGRLNQFWIVPDRTGTFYGQCSELCGVNHGFMPIVIEAAALWTFLKAMYLAYQA